MAQLTELFAEIDRLTRSDAHSNALRALAEAVDGEDLSDQHRQMIRDKYSAVQILQAERFASIHKQVTSHLTEPLKAMGDPSDLETLEARLESLAAIDESRPLDEARQGLSQLRLISEIEWAYTRVASLVQNKLSEASQKGVNGVVDAKKVLGDLRDSILVDWNQRAKTDLVAGGVVPRLRKLLEETSKAVEGLAQRENVLTTSAGMFDFYAIEEWYKRQITPTTSGELQIPAPTSMPRMVWQVGVDDGVEGRRYVAGGEPLDLQTWHDAFIKDAQDYAREKVERDLAEARSIVATEPKRAQQKIQVILYGDPDQRIRPYFQVPDDIANKARNFLESSELSVALKRYERVQELINQADQLRPSDSLGAMKALWLAAGEDIVLPDTIRVVRESVIPKVNSDIRLLTEVEREAVDANPPRADRWSETLQEWLKYLPDYTVEPLMRERLDPDQQLAGARDLVESSLAFCRLVSRLSAIELLANQSGILGVSDWLDGFSNDAVAAGFGPDEFRLYRQLRTWLQTESDVKGQVAAKLSSEELFPADPKQTNIARLNEELEVARRGQHSAYAQLVGALEARNLLHQECTQSEASSLEARKLLLLNVTTAMHVRPADKAIAEARLKEIEKLETATEGQRSRIAKSLARADTPTLRSFRQAWDELEGALQANDAVLIGEIRSAQVVVRTKITEKARSLVERNPDGVFDDNSASEMRQWIALAKETGAGEAERILEDHFNRPLWEWDAQHGLAEERLQALLRLSHLEPERWDLQLVAVGLEVALREMEERRKMLEQDTRRVTEADQSLTMRHPLLRSSLERNAAYLRKLAELKVWERDLANARHYSAQAASSPDKTSVSSQGLLCTQSEVESLLEYAEFREQIETYLDDAKVPSGSQAQRMRESYLRLFRSEKQTPATQHTRHAQ